MWFIYTIIFSFLGALVNFTDEHLATNNKLPKNSTIHTKVGSVFLMSTLMSFVGATLFFLITKDVSISNTALILATTSAIPIVLMYGSYFYLLQSYPVHQVAPLFQLTSIWLLAFELFSGAIISVQGIIGIFVMVYGAYLIDAGTFKWKIPTKLFLTVLPATSMWAIAMFLVKLASKDTTAFTITFWQLLSIGFIGLLTFFVIQRFREGFIYRIKKQGKLFLSLSAANETFAQTGYFFSYLAISIAPVATYVSALNGLQNVFILILFYLFPQSKRSKITKIQWFAVFLIAIGVVLMHSS